MSRVFVIADTHFGHANILGIRREFASSIEEHDERLIENWNAEVRARDVVYHLGDVGLCPKSRLEDIVAKLNGHLCLVAGNHDPASIGHWFAKAFGAKVFRNCILTHIPIHPQEMYWDVNVHGHLHGNLVRRGADRAPAKNPVEGATLNFNDPRYLCVSCEQINYRPIEFDVALEIHRDKWGSALLEEPRTGGMRKGG